MLHLHRSERTDALVDALRADLARPPADPFAPDLVAVPTRGVERWLAQQLSLGLGARAGRRDGVCANVLFPTPREVVEQALAAASGIDPDADPWAPERAVWPLLAVVEEHLGEPWLRALASYLRHADRRLGTVRHLAALFDRYAVHRPEVLVRWAAGADDHWQAELWRCLRARLGVPSPAERLGPACARLVAEPALAPLPERLALFGLTRLPTARLQALEALAAHRDVHLHLLHPSPALWERVAADGQRPVRRRDDRTAALARSPLLASWGQDARELQLVLARGGASRTDRHHPAEDPPGTLLGRLQADVRADRPPPDAPDARPLLDPADRSVAVHSCHGRARQVEVLRDALLHVLAEDTTLEPRDVIVMCPDIEAFAPLVHATFGAGETLADDEAGDDLPDVAPPVPGLHVRLADRSLRQTNPVLAVVARVLELADGRLTASEVLDLADREPVRRRFGLDDDDIARVEDWVAATGVRWGLDAEHRAPFGLGDVDHGTWRRGLDRLLAGAAMTEDGSRLVHGVLPLDDVGSGDIDRAGRLAELVGRLGAAVDRCARPQAPAEWAATLAFAADALAACAPQDAWQRAELDGLLADLAEQAGGSAVPVSVAELRDLLGDRLRGRPTRAGFRTGHITFCTLHPMRAVPHRVVCLLGLDDEVFPRAAPRDGDDLVLADPHVGDRDGRVEDRQMLLDALMSARERLVVTFSGKDERTNVRRPPAVPLGELLEVIDRTVRAEEGSALDQVLVEHPLQPFDPQNFDGARPWGHDPTALAGARALRGPRRATPPFLDAPLPAPDEPVVELDALVRFVERPVRTFLRRRLGVVVGTWGEEPSDALPVELDALERWALGQRVLDARLDGTPHRATLLAEIARGTLPPGALAVPVVVHEVGPVADTLFALTQQEAPGEAASVDVRAGLACGRVVGGTVAGVVGDVVRLVTYSRLGPKHRLAAWARLLVLAAARPDRPWRAVTIGRARRDGRDDATVSIARVGPLDAAVAREHLAALVDLYDRGMREALPLPCKASAAYAAAAASRGREQALEAAHAEWQSGFQVPGEDREPEHEVVFGTGAPLDALLDPAAPEDERWAAGEPSRFGQLARRLWAGPLAHEAVEDR